jgi:chromosomal replication initiation ATPase DnaA
MFTQTETETKLEAEIHSLLAKLKETTKDTEEYGILVDRMSKLHKLKTDEQTQTQNAEELLHKLKPEERFKQISPDTVLVVVANIFGILWLTRYERERVINSKALGFVMRPNR